MSDINVELTDASKPKMNLADLICHLRQELLDAREQKNKIQLGQRFTVFGVLLDAVEASYSLRDGRIIGILEDLSSTTRDSLMDEDWKSNIPSVDEIKDATS